MGSKFFGNKSEQPAKKKGKRKSNNTNVKRQSSVKKSGRGR